MALNCLSRIKMDHAHPFKIMYLMATYEFLLFDSRSLNPYLGKICPKKLKKERSRLGINLNHYFFILGSKHKWFSDKLAKQCCGISDLKLLESGSPSSQPTSGVLSDVRRTF